MERDCYNMKINGKNINFNSHAHVERDKYKTWIDEYNEHFNSHAHVERDDTDSIKYLHPDISTHTLTWSVTISSLGLLKSSRNFNSHAHVERDEEMQGAEFTNANFNSHAHVERDRN